MTYSRSKFGDITSQKRFQVGQFSVTATASTMASGYLNSGVRLNPEGSADLVVGTSKDVGLTNGYVLDSEVFIDIDDMNKVFVKASTTGSTISFVAS